MPAPISIDALPLTVLIPESPRRPIVAYDSQAALRVAIVEHDFVANLDETWDSPGVYFLLWPKADESDNRLPVYVGEAAQGLRKRIGQHVSGKDGWHRAVLIARDTKYGFNSAQVGWLEGRLWKSALASEHVRPTNKTQPKDETLPDYDRAVLETVVIPILRVMRLLGFPLDPYDDSQPSLIPHRYFGIAVKDLIKAGKLKAGDTLVFTYPGHPATATVLGNGSLEVGGQAFGSPSAAAAKVRGGATNGWGYWALLDDPNQTLAFLRAQLLVPIPPKNGEAGGI
jgi:hypothetical protein